MSRWSDRLNRIWYGGQPPPWYLRLLSMVYQPAARLQQSRSRKQARHPGVPVVVIGNLTAGGSGKTPLLIHLVSALNGQFNIGVVSRGYGSTAGQGPVHVTRQSSPVEVGDEPLMIHQQTGVPVVVGSDRVAAATALLNAEPIDLIFSDDGLQHGRLARDLEVVVIDHARGLGNGRLLPAGPLREPSERLESVDLVVHNGDPNSMILTINEAINLISGQRATLDAMAAQPVTGVAGIGHPNRFFEALESLGLKVQRRPFPDHHPYTADDLNTLSGQTVLTTPKDAVKLKGLLSALSASEQSRLNLEVWEVPATVKLAAPLAEQLTTAIADLVIKDA